ncbi:hypothetical protein CL615_04450 [archaeon]|jgi:hypothetical protein|nr:hypothetical protein [archaeon]MDP6547644.1 hypothetical protein [Candidatus Woesearchaeota archaeon]|tara:strand:+ start:605 stop:907 length:303 start_codon:yes stop_codon:yes gene_type:complete
MVDSLIIPVHTTLDSLIGKYVQINLRPAELRCDNEKHILYEREFRGILKSYDDTFIKLEQAAIYPRYAYDDSTKNINEYVLNKSVVGLIELKRRPKEKKH